MPQYITKNILTLSNQPKQSIGVTLHNNIMMFVPILNYWALFLKKSFSWADRTIVAFYLV